MESFSLTVEEQNVFYELHPQNTAVTHGLIFCLMKCDLSNKHKTDVKYCGVDI